MYAGFTPKIQIFALLLLFATGQIATYMLVDYYHFSKTVHHTAMEKAEEKCVERENFFREFFDSAQKNLYGIRENALFRHYLETMQGEAEVRELFLTLAQSRDDIMQLRYLDASGMERLRIDRDSESGSVHAVASKLLQNKNGRYYFADSKTRTLEQVWFSDLDLNIEHGEVEQPFRPTMRAILPLERDGRFGGILIINYFMDGFLQRLANMPMYKAILADAEGYPLIHYDPERSWGRYREPRYSLAEELPEAARQLFSCKEFRNDRIVARQLFLPTEHPLYLILQLNDDTIQALMAAQREHYLFVAAIVFLFSVLVSLLISRIVNRIGLDLAHTRRLEKLFRGIFEHAAVGIAQKDMHGRWIRVNDKMLEMTGYRFDELRNLSAEAITYGPDYAKEAVLVNELIEGKRRSFQLEKRLLRKDGALVWVNLTMSLLRNERNEADSLVAIIEDLSEIERNRQELRQSATVFENTAEGVIITDPQGTIVNVNKAFETITGRSRNEVIGARPSLFRSGRHDRHFYAWMWRQIKETGFWSGEIWNRRKNGEVYPQWLTISSVSNGAGELENYIAVFSDISALKASQEKADYYANYDQLTGLPNRLLLRAILDHSIDVSKRQHTKTAVVMLDIDNFKNINDSYGHTFGDDLVVELAARLKEIIRPEDTLARIGGDELVIIMGDLEETRTVIQTAQRIIESFTLPFNIRNRQFSVTASLGISLYPDDGFSAENLLKNADAAMFDAKKDGKHTYKFYDDAMTALSFERVVIENALKTALERNEFELVYQPQFDLSIDRCIGFEALIRWNNPALNKITPDRFIPIAEETKQIIPLGEYVLETACDTVLRWKREGLCNGRIAINVSGVQLEYSDFATTLQSQIERYGIEPSHLEIEVTESVIMKNPDRWVAVLHKIKALGVSISIDDFGTGYSSLGYLRRLPFDTLKIDKTFVDDVPGDRDACAIADTIVRMAQSLGMTTLAEGVETEAQKEYLKGLGCTFMQGYLMGRPMREADAYAWLKEHVAQRQ